MPPKVAPPAEGTEVETPAEPTPAEALGIDQAAFDAVGAALSQGESEVEPGELEGDANQETPAEEPKTPVVAKTKEGEEPKKEEPLSKSWAAVKKKEAQVSQMTSQLRREIAEVKKLRESLTGAQKSQADVIALLKADPRNLEKFGIPLTEFIDRILTDGAPTADTKHRESNEEVSALKKSVEELKGIIQKQQVGSAEEKFRERFRTAIASEDFELLRSYEDPEGAAIRFAGEYFQQHGKMDLTPQQIAGHLQDTWREHLRTLRSAKAVRREFGLPDDEETEVSDEEQEPKAPSRSSKGPKAKPKTVTSTMSSSPARGTPAPQRTTRQSDEDIVREAARLVPKDAWEQMG